MQEGVWGLGGNLDAGGDCDLSEGIGVQDLGGAMGAGEECDLVEGCWRGIGGAMYAGEIVGQQCRKGVQRVWPMIWIKKLGCGRGWGARCRLWLGGAHHRKLLVSSPEGPLGRFCPPQVQHVDMH